MNKKLLGTTALVSAALISSAAVAEFKIGADMSATITMGSDKNTNGSNSGTSVGNETNLLLSGSSDLSNGWKASYSGKLEFDGAATAGNPDHEYELKIGSGDMYLSFASDGGQSSRTSMTPFVSYPIGSTANAVTPSKPAFAGDSYISGVHQGNNIGIGGKVGDGNIVLRYAPNASSTENDDVATSDNINGGKSGTKGSGYLIAYNGKLGPVGINASHTQEQPSVTSSTTGDAKESRVGLVYSFGAVKIGADYITYDSGEASDVNDRKTTIVGAAYAVDKNTTIGAYVQSTTDERAAGGRQDEDMKMISVGYNLGGGSIALSVVDVEGLGNAATGTSADYQGIMLTTKVGF